jgi:hypothetical protein
MQGGKESESAAETRNMRMAHPLSIQLTQS